MSNVTAGAIMTLAIPLGLLMVVLAVLMVSHRRELRRWRGWRARSTDA